MRFVDEVSIEVVGGKGGNGAASFRREKYIPFGGPDGGDGGRGGSVFAVAQEGINTLVDFRYTRRHEGRNGENGHGSDCYGKSGEDVVLRLPVGTMVFDDETNVLLFDLTEAGQTVILARGGDGGLGNLHFKSSTNRAPRQFTKGGEGEHRQLRLELKVLADVGLLGMPNAGKSTLITKVSNARPKIADYPFTTLYPNLGVVRVSDENSFLMADIPGLIEGASEGAGLGHLFLRHLARTRVLLHLIDFAPFVESIDPLQDAVAIVKELEKYDAALAAKPRWLVLNKVDMLDTDGRSEKVKRFAKSYQKACGLKEAVPVFPISALTGEGTQDLVWALGEYLQKEQRKELKSQQALDHIAKSQWDSSGLLSWEEMQALQNTDKK